MSRCRDPITTWTRDNRWTVGSLQKGMVSSVKKDVNVCLERWWWGQCILMGWGWFQWDERKRAVPFRTHTLVGLWLVVKKGFWVAYMSQWSPLGINRLTLGTEWDSCTPPTHTTTTHPSLTALAPLLSFKSICPCQRWKCKVGGTQRGSWH